MAGVEPEAWDEFSEQQVRRLVRLGYFPLISLLFGLPGETPADVERTLRWVQRLSGERLAIFPLFNAPRTPARRRSASKKCPPRTGGSSARATT